MKRAGAALLALAAMYVAPAFATDTVYYYHTDALHSEVVITDAGHHVVERAYYGPYGEVLNRPLRDGPGYGGHEEDAATGLDNLQQRYYDPITGRFPSIDPVDVDTTTGENFNRYAYVNDNPYRFTDPDGRDPCTGSHVSCPSATKIIHVAAHWGEQKVTQAVSHAVQAVATTAKQYAQEARNFVSPRDKTMTVGVSGIAGTPLKGNGVGSPGVALLADGGVTIDFSIGQVALQGSIGPAASFGGGAAASGNFAFGLNDGPLTTGFGQANTAFAQVSAVPESGVPLELGGAVQWSKGGSSVSFGVKPGVGTYIGTGVGRVFTGTVATPPIFERQYDDN